MYLRQPQKTAHNANHMHQGLGFTGQIAQPQAAFHSNQEQRDRNAGKVVLADFCASPELFEMVSVSVDGMKGDAVIQVRSLRRRELLTVKGFRAIRTAKSNEIKASARQGSDDFDHYWQGQNQNYYY